MTGYVTKGAELLLWTRPEWLESAHAWIHARLDEQGIRPSGAIEQVHVRPWSTVLRVATSDGILYFKASAPVQAYEVPLTHALAEWRPDCIAPVLAIDLERSWMLLPDGGTRLRELIRSRADVWHWQIVLPLYADLQIGVTARRNELLALGVADQRLAGLPSRYMRLLEDTEALRVDRPGGLTSDEHRRLRAVAPRFAQMCSELAEFGVPESLQHDDFHDGNVFLRDGRYRFFDWGDSCISHPFHTVRITLQVVAHAFEIGADDRILGRLRDAYLEPWTRYAQRDRLLAAFDLAQRVGTFCRALTFQRFVSAMGPPFRERYAETVPSIVRRFLDAVA